jgi:hypothetical protein
VADVAAAPSPEQASNPLFQQLASRYGVNAALALLPLFSGDSSTASKAFAGGSLAGSGAQAAGALGGSPALASLGSKIGTGLGLAGLGYNAYQTLNNPNLDAAHKGAAIGENVGGLGATYLYGGYGALPAIATALGNQFQKSGSPQVQGLGRGLTTAGHPVADVTKSPFNTSGAKQFTETMVLGGPAGMALSNAIGFNPFEPTPTKGTEFRTGMQSIFSKLGLPGFNRADANVYTAGADPASFYAKYNPQAVSDAQKLGTLLAQYSPHGKNNQDYSTQTQNILLNTFGNNISGQMPDILKKLGVS